MANYHPKENLQNVLQVGRSTVREALRSLELLGIIETRRGEGTFLSDFRKHQLVELLSTFILQDAKSKKDVHTTMTSIRKRSNSDNMSQMNNFKNNQYGMLS